LLRTPEKLFPAPTTGAMLFWSMKLPVQSPELI
jgi:hypothetical protein